LWSGRRPAYDPRDASHPPGGRLESFPLVGLVHELGCHGVIRVLEKKMCLECGVASDLDLIVHRLCNLVR